MQTLFSKKPHQPMRFRGRDRLHQVHSRTKDVGVLLALDGLIPSSGHTLGSLKPTNLIDTLTNIYVKHSLTNRPCLTVLQGQQRRAAICQVFAGVFFLLGSSTSLTPVGVRAGRHKAQEIGKSCSERYTQSMLSRSDLPSPHLVYLPGACVKRQGNHPTPTQDRRE